MRSSLQGMQSDPREPAQLVELRRRAWREQGVYATHPDEITDPQLRRAVIADAERRYGRRQPQ